MAVLPPPPPSPPSYFPPVEVHHQVPPPKGNGMAVAAMVLGILAVVLCWVMLVNFILGVLGIIFGALGIARANKIGGTGKGMALAGLITGIFGILAGIVVVVFVLRAVEEFGGHLKKSTWHLAKIKVDRLANEAYPQWAMNHPEKACPDSIADLRDYALDTKDVWGHELKILCGPSLPPGVKGMAVLSVGEDGIEGTEDDIKSWESVPR